MNSESQNVEYKENWRDEYLKWICGFANAQGGRIYIGIDDSGNVVGIKNAKKLLEDLPNKVSVSMGILVDVNLHRENGLEYISIDVAPSTSPIGYKGKFYYRTGSTNQLLNGIALENFLLKKNNHTWDSLSIAGTSIEDIDKESVEYFVNRGIRLGRLPSGTLGLPVERILGNLNLISNDGSLTNAAMLLFGRHPQRCFAGAVFRIGRFRDNEADILFQDEIAGSLIHMPDTVMDYLKGKYLKSFIHFEGLQRIEKLEIPEEGLREILCNAIVHKDYRGVHTQMKVYDDHIRLWNEGGLIDGMTVESLRKEHSSRPRNKLIAQVFYLAGFIETWGRGIWKVDKVFASESLPLPEYEENSGGVAVIIPRRNPEILTSEVNGPVNGPVKQLLGLIRNNPNSSYEDYCSMMQISRTTLRRYLNILKKEGFVERVGADKNGFWKILKQ